MYIRIDKYVHVCIYVCLYVHICIYIYIYISMSFEQQMLLERPPAAELVLPVGQSSTKEDQWSRVSCADSGEEILAGKVQLLR